MVLSAGGVECNLGIEAGGGWIFVGVPCFKFVDTSKADKLFFNGWGRL